MKKIIAAAAVAAAGAYAARWAHNYRRVMKSLRGVPMDEVPGGRLTPQEYDAFAQIANSTCMGACCVETTDFDHFWEE